jgi:hypothetical protein
MLLVEAIWEILWFQKRLNMMRVIITTPRKQPRATAAKPKTVVVPPIMITIMLARTLLAVVITPDMRMKRMKRMKRMRAVLCTANDLLVTTAAAVERVKTSLPLLLLLVLVRPAVAEVIEKKMEMEMKLKMLEELTNP